MEEEVKNNVSEEAQKPEEVQEEVVAAPAEGEGTAESAAEPKQRDLFYERIRTNFPEGKYDEDEDEYFRSANSAMDTYEKESKTLKDLTEKLNTRLSKDPQEAEVMLDWLDGVDIREAIARHMGPEALSIPEEGSEEYEGWSKASEERRKELADMQAQVEEYRANAEASDAALEEFAAENNLSDEQKAEFSKFITEDLLPAIYAGKMDKNFYKLLQNGRNYDVDIEGAREQGRVDGRNEKIEVEKKHLAGSGLPNGGAGGNAATEVDAPKSENKTVDFLAKMAKRRV